MNPGNTSVVLPEQRLRLGVADEMPDWQLSLARGGGVNARKLESFCEIPWGAQDDKDEIV
jgi:hypothetical protein